ncbi:YqhV family protein [Priestia koreensis]|uniref:YqhV family protein n=1 Tax=Priestia koreensis TaxID=284581 RepID=UPI001F5744D6|nr:YqhV family protein [Priestia koreensis]MCM3002434.1 YqhV family protein [Priestia koreensis]UNL84155.1 YqhV family protein [Priestia koreensis]
MKHLLAGMNSSVLTMACLRFVSSFIEFVAAILIFTSNDVKKALMINSLLALVGPLVMVSSFTIGLVAVADQLSFGKIALIAVGVIMILVGVFK